jgi:hypothetical protein
MKLKVEKKFLLLFMIYALLLFRFSVETEMHASEIFEDTEVNFNFTNLN